MSINVGVWRPDESASYDRGVDSGRVAETHSIRTTIGSAPAVRIGEILTAEPE